MKKILLILPLFLLGCKSDLLRDEYISGKLISVGYSERFNTYLEFTLLGGAGVPTERRINGNYIDRRDYDNLLPFLNKNVKIYLRCVRFEKCTMKIEELK